MAAVTVYTSRQAAEILHLSLTTLRKYIREGKLKAVRMGNGWRITEESLKAFAETGVDAGVVRPGSRESPATGTGRRKPRGESKGK